MNEFEDKVTGLIEYTQLLILLARKLDRMDSEEELHEAFQVFDHDEDGLISLTDLRYFMNNIAGEKSMDDKQLMEMIREADFDGDGFLNERGYRKHEAFICYIVFEFFCLSQAFLFRIHSSHAS